MKMLSLDCQLLYVTHTYVRSVYKEFPRYNLSIEIKDHKFWRFKTLLYNHHSSKPGHIPAIASWLFS